VWQGIPPCGKLDNCDEMLNIKLSVRKFQERRADGRIILRGVLTRMCPFVVAAMNVMSHKKS
jgi:hypothetical protein